jgi:glycosyltransferase involved in cell wall biosynthesis
MARASSGLCRALARRGHEVTVVTALLDPSHSRDERCGGVRVVRFPGPASLLRRLVPWGRGLRRFLHAARGGFDVAHLHGHRNGLAVSSARALGRLRVPWVLAPAGTFPHHGQRRLAKRVFDGLAGHTVVSAARAMVAVSRAEARDLPRPAEVIPNGVDMPSPPGRVTRAAGDGPRLLFVGSDRPQKRGHLLPRMLAELPDAELTLAGPCDGLLARFGSGAPRVRTLGVLDPQALATAYAAADLVVHPAVGEAFGLVPFEAALLGTASVVAGGHGCGEWFSLAGGCVVPPDEPRAMARAVAERLADPARRALEASDVAAFTRRELTWDRAAAAVESLYERLAAEGTSR